MISNRYRIIVSPFMRVSTLFKGLTIVIRVPITHKVSFLIRIQKCLCNYGQLIILVNNISSGYRKNTNFNHTFKLGGDSLKMSKNNLTIVVCYHTTGDGILAFDETHNDRNQIAFKKI